jgi:hypothetical protein
MGSVALKMKEPRAPKGPDALLAKLSRMKEIPPAPEGWNKTISDLSAEVDAGLRPYLASPEVDWARDYERQLLPPDTRFPRQGDVYEALEEFEAAYMTSWAAPFTGGGKAKLARGERVEIRYAPLDTQPILVYAHAVNYKDVEGRVVPEAERKAETYTGFYFAIKTADLNKRFRLVHAWPGC